jgi:hypothetical protein
MAFTVYWIQSAALDMSFQEARMMDVCQKALDENLNNAFIRKVHLVTSRGGETLYLVAFEFAGSHKERIAHVTIHKNGSSLSLIQ